MYRMKELRKAIYQSSAYIEIQNAGRVAPVKEEKKIDGRDDEASQTRICCRQFPRALTVAEEDSTEGNQQWGYHQEAQGVKGFPEIIGKNFSKEGPRFFKKETEAQGGEGDVKQPFILFYEQ